jgi:hypothetical protein
VIVATPALTLLLMSTMGSAGCKNTLTSCISGGMSTHSERDTLPVVLLFWGADSLGLVPLPSHTTASSCWRAASSCWRPQTHSTASASGMLLWSRAGDHRLREGHCWPWLLLPRDGLQAEGLLPLLKGTGPQTPVSFRPPLRQRQGLAAPAVLQARHLQRPAATSGQQ